MTVSYLLKLVCLGLASFFLVHLALALVVRAATPVVLRMAARTRPALAARLLFFTRMLPAGFGVLIVAGLCVPSYLWLEPKTATSEGIGWLCLGFSMLTVLLWAVSIRRGLFAIARSIRYLQLCRRNGRQTEVPGETLPVWMVEEPAALFAMAGITRPSLLISRQAMSALSGDQLDAALRHERAHWTSRDNLKRLLLLLAPDMLPFLHGFGKLEGSWARYTERAADDRAVAGDAGRSLSLACALVSVGRLGIAQRASSLVAPLLAGDDDLSERVQRLLTAAPETDNASEGWMGCLVAGAAVMLSASVIAIGLQPALLYPVHWFLEHLIQ
ncbi:MAG TPA: M56 family metallopeptidase [Bryobacteraceae bacterium]|nr:M56 family metallopeptidase [Bryobacteraceae bacterium]